jgi:hypothetical protein
LHICKTIKPEVDDFVKSPAAALRCILSHCSVPVNTPHYFVFARFSVHLNLFALSPDIFFTRPSKLKKKPNEQLLKSQSFEL